MVLTLRSQVRREIAGPLKGRGSRQKRRQPSRQSISSELDFSLLSADSFDQSFMSVPDAESISRLSGASSMLMQLRPPDPDAPLEEGQKVEGAEGPRDADPLTTDHRYCGRLGRPGGRDGPP